MNIEIQGFDKSRHKQRKLIVNVFRVSIQSEKLRLLLFGPGLFSHKTCLARLERVTCNKPDIGYIINRIKPSPKWHNGKAC